MTIENETKIEFIDSPEIENGTYRLSADLIVDGTKVDGKITSKFVLEQDNDNATETWRGKIGYELNDLFLMAKDNIVLTSVTEDNRIERFQNEITSRIKTIQELYESIKEDDSSARKYPCSSIKLCEICNIKGTPDSLIHGAEFVVFGRKEKLGSLFFVQYCTNDKLNKNTWNRILVISFSNSVKKEFHTDENCPYISMENVLNEYQLFLSELINKKKNPVNYFVSNIKELLVGMNVNYKGVGIFKHSIFRKIFGWFPKPSFNDADLALQFTEQNRKCIRKDCEKTYEFKEMMHPCKKVYIPIITRNLPDADNCQLLCGPCYYKKGLKVASIVIPIVFGLILVIIAVTNLYLTWFK